MELAIYALALGFAAAVIVPLVYGLVAKFLPTSLTAGVSLPTTFPTSFQALGVSVILWGAFMALAIWALSLLRPVRTAINAKA